MITLALIHCLALGSATAAQAALDAAAAAVDRGDLPTAALRLKEAIAADPDDVEALSAAGLVALRLFDNSEAVRLFDRVLALDPYDDEARLHRTTALWRLGDATRARGSINDLLARQPAWPQALALNTHLDERAELAAPSPWRPLARVDVSGGYDSNLMLLSSSVAEASQSSTALMAVDASLGTAYAANGRPVSAFAHVTSLQSPDKQLADWTSTLVGGALIGRQWLDELEAVVDLRYDELFTNSFATHRQRVMSPTLYGSLPLGTTQRLRLLVGADYRMLFNSPQSPDNVTLRLGVRDTLTIGRVTAALDLEGRRNWATTNTTAATLRSAEFLEGAAHVTADTTLVGELAAQALAGGSWRRLYQSAGGNHERQLDGQVGLRYGLGWAELHAEYAFTKNFADQSAFSFTRHAVFAGVRAWFD